MLSANPNPLDRTQVTVKDVNPNPILTCTLGKKWILFKISIREIFWENCLMESKIAYFNYLGQSWDRYQMLLGLAVKFEQLLASKTSLI